MPSASESSAPAPITALASPCYVFGDSHLGYASQDTERNVLAYLRYLRDVAGSVVINGDLFEFWFEWRTVIPRSGMRVLSALADLAERGVPVLMIAGNHDCWGGNVLRADGGVDFRFGPWTGDLAGWSARIEHGDGLRQREDRGYRGLRRILRNPLAIRAFRWIHPDIATRLATGSSGASRRYAPKDAGRGTERPSRIGNSKPTGVSICSSTVIRTSRRSSRVTPRSVYANAGSWLDAPTFLRVTPERIALRHWLGSAEGPDLDAFDRVAKEALPKL